MRKLFRSAAIAAAAALALAGCSTGAAGSDDTSGGGSGSAETAADFPVTVEHAYGETVIEEAPERVATVAWVNADIALALGTVPVGMPTDEYGGNDAGSTPWKDEALAELGAELGSDKAPAQYSEADGINFNAVAETTPDLILAASSGITQEEYDKLSEIAPVVAFPETAWGTSWQDATLLTGKALGKSDAAEQLVEETDKLVADKAAEYPNIKDKTYIAANLEPDAADGVSIYTSIDARPQFLDAIGMKPAEVIVDAEKDAGDGFYIPWSPEKASELDSDIMLTWSESADATAAIKADPLLSQIPAVQKDSLVALTDETLTLAVSAASPLSVPWAIDDYLTQIADAVENASA